MTARQSGSSRVLERPARPAGGSATTAAASRALAALRTDLLDEDQRVRVEATASRVAEADVYVVAVGEFKRGKSSLLNALVGEPVLPIGVVPLTAVVTVLRNGEARAVGVYADGRRGDVDAARLTDYVTEEGNPGNRLGLSRVEVSSLRFTLPPGAALIDTPGLRSVVDGGEDHTLDFLPQVDVALVVLSVDQPLSGDEQDLAVRLRDQGAEIVFVLNKTDYLSPDEVEAAGASSRSVSASPASRTRRCSPSRRSVRPGAAPPACPGCATTSPPSSSAVTTRSGAASPRVACAGCSTSSR